MSTSITSAQADRTASGSAWALAGAAVFLVAYLAVSPVAGLFATGDIPLPTDPGEEVKAFLVASPLAAVSGAVLQAVSVLGFAAFARVVVPMTGNRTLGVVAGVSVAAMLISSAITLVSALFAADLSADNLSMLRMASFYAGGVLNVATLGFVAFVASRRLLRIGAVGKGTAILGYVVGTLSMLSVISLAVYYANLFLPLGRVGSMVWTVLAAVVLARRTGRSDR
ncbi:hypothetical protein G5C66_04185 [Nocardioides sp. KC13]|uniref:DUF4386 domain-containing protein n=1 Tax=Nocardioides turkmenicus TaxID=2711220 RepID=A0A6M1QVQ5_9ACTN|nr:hypothetical protein [Nocardioides sp. KC13]NGN91934.1 hypothetical protein [Nocardioides sp. KC13]